MKTIDVAMWIGQYPFRGIPNSSIADLKRQMSALEIERAIVAPFEGIFWENNLDAYDRAAEQFANDRAIEVWPVVCPGAVHGIERLLDRHKPRGLRLLPNYHGYKLSDASVAEVMSLAKSRGMIVQIFQRIADERWHYLMKVPAVPMDDFLYITSIHTEQPILLSGVNPFAQMTERLRSLPHLYADISRNRGPQFVYEKLAQSMPMDKLVFGSLWPIQIIEATHWQITSSRIDESIKQNLLYNNAARLLGQV
ncbi:MAG TPA: amidohydrolase family protein [Tepidisphaeraceae bacterium]|jgi:predicted TIM-barrel fold metal-dependent hydrolase|nr:amidohydrolase family protein [Tepidisphaeraceae bacterium]